jgi:hypothetical protein
VCALALALIPTVPAAAAAYVPDVAADAYLSVVFAGGAITVAKDCSITGDVHGNSNVSLAKGTMIDGNLSAGGTVDLQGATVTGTIASPAALRSLPRLPTAEEARGLADRVLEGDHSFPDGTSIDDVVFVTGTARFEGSVDGIGSVIAGVEIRFGNGTPARPIQLAADTDMTFVSLGGIWLGLERPLRGGLVAGGSVEIHKALDMEGLIVAGGDVALSKDSMLAYRPLDREPPVIRDLRPPDGARIVDPRTEIGASFSDEASGVDPASIRLVVDGADRTGEAVVDAGAVSFMPPLPLAIGEHSVEVTVADRARNLAKVTWGFTVLDVDPPVIVIEHPQEGSLTNQSTVEVRGTVTDASAVPLVTVNGSPATIDGERFAATLDLEQGFNAILVVATDSWGNVGSAIVSLTIDSEPPQVTLIAPPEGQLVNGDRVRIRGEATDHSGIASVTVAGLPAPQVDGRFELDVPLAQEGPQAIEVTATDRAGNVAQVTRQVVRFTLPEVTITAPADLAFVAATTTAVAGTIGENVVAVSVNGVPAGLDGATFLAEGVPLIEGGNTVTATAVAASGHVATATIHVVRDLTPPRVFIHQPEAGSVIRQGTISVSGLVNDIVPGTVNADEATVTVNGVTAVVANRSFFVESVPLGPEENVLHAVAVDASGNAGEDAVVVHFDAAPAAQVRAVAGDHQTGVIGDPLPVPLVAELVDATGQPVANRYVIFRAQGTNGSLDDGRRQVAVTTDAAGRAQTIFTLGTRAGAANQVVEASAVGFAGPAVFTASALPAEPAAIVVDSGGLQVGVAGQRVPRPLIAAVIDSGHNRLEGIPVVFRVVQGAGRFADGSGEAVVTTDSDGRAIVTFTLDSEEGVANNVVEARIVGFEEGPLASFVASGRAAGDPAATSISGVVLDNTNVPIAGVTLRVKHTTLTAVTNTEGQFRIAGAPVGAVKLIVDGSTVSRPGAWPDLEFDLVTIAGRDNTVNMPIYLLPLDLENGIMVDETRGGTLTLPDLPGFALDVEAGSVTFPGGGRSGLVSVTVVHNDKVPMVPNFGQQPRLIVTIQPAGARFDPPARLTLPNLEGLAPGEVTEMYSFDHDLGHFVSIGPATVSADATVIVSVPGVGIVKAGWHCGGNPATTATTHDCPQCQRCSGSQCVNDDGPGCDDGNGCTVDDRCSGGRCKGDPVRILSVEASLDEIVDDRACVGQEVQFRVEVEQENCANLEYTWEFGDGTISREKNPRHIFEEPGTYVVSVLVRCGNCPQEAGGDSLVVEAAEAKEYELKYMNFIPVPYVLGPPVLYDPFMGCEDGPAMVYAGDDRGPDPDAVTYRTKSAVKVVAEEACSPSGVVEGSLLKDVHPTKVYAFNALDDGVLDASDDDATGDCDRLHLVATASSSEFEITPERISPTAVKVHFAGNAKNPLAPLSFGITWEFDVIIDSEVNRWTLIGAHDCYPAHELYINNGRIFFNAPDSNTFGEIAICLSPPMNVDLSNSDSLP